MAKYPGVIGGDKLRRFIAERRKIAAWVNDVTVEVGYKGRIAPLAELLEYGNRRTKLPGRPAFRQALPEVRRTWDRECTELARLMSRPDTTLAQFKQRHLQAVLKVRDVIRRSYLQHRSAPLSAAQTARKVGTPGAGRQLVGHKGPRLIERHLHAYIDGRKVG